ncbi:hypothetical protein [Anaerocolumna chitinilytica]|uniref:Uncharacterized protein n=1 Tax=Anaerocolumna chitinilytica TaxID=1727145 RepID=A0A7I8DKV6_9FIRM|nr:hypothetical protein [Anaerocolumna chitinilytica]BCJ99088.1 hypothetical protein bsdcttw_21290 [Anaerocolumna chitinilytica]
MKIRSYQERGIQFSFVTLQTSELLTQQELFDYLFNGQSLCPPDSIYQKGDKLVMETCSGNGLIEFSFASEQISGQADTSLAGPGFHRAVVLLLDQIGIDFGMRLILTDDSGFFADRDFEKLQDLYVEKLMKALKELSASGEQGYLDKDKLLPAMQGIEIRPIREEEILTPMGAFSSNYSRML